jgi:L-fuculose-phosphate aldolase
LINDLQLKQQLADYGRRLAQRGWVANHDGNLSLRLPRERYLCTPTALAKGQLTAEMMLVVDRQGMVQSGRGRPFSELNLHLAYYQARPDVQAVIHAHPPTATGFGVAGRALDRPFLPEAVVSLGPVIPTVPPALPGNDAVLAVAPFLDEFDALLLAGNGAIAVGVDLEQAFLRLELVEHISRIALVAEQLGGVQPLPQSFLPSLLEARRKAGFGPEARGAPPADRSVVGSDQVDKPRGGDLERLVRTEIARVLGER